MHYGIIVINKINMRLYNFIKPLYKNSSKSWFLIKIYFYISVFASSIFCDSYTFSYALEYGNYDHHYSVYILVDHLYALDYNYLYNKYSGIDYFDNASSLD